MPFGIHPGFLIVVLILVLIIFGPGRLPELGGAVGKAMREFRKATSDLQDEIKHSTTTSEPGAGSASTTAASNTNAHAAGDAADAQRPTSPEAPKS